MNTLTYTLISYRSADAHNESRHEIFVSRNWQEVVQQAAILCAANAKGSDAQPWRYWLLVDGQFAGPQTLERLKAGSDVHPQERANRGV